MSNPWDGIDSIWDGWEHQCQGGLDQEQPAGYSPTLGLVVQAHCAIGFLHERIEQNPRFRREIYRRADAIEKWLITNSLDTIATANDSGWTPEQFRELDRRLEWEYQQERFRREIDGIPELAKEGVRE